MTAAKYRSVVELAFNIQPKKLSKGISFFGRFGERSQ